MNFGLKKFIVSDSHGHLTFLYGLFSTFSEITRRFISSKQYLGSNLQTPLSLRTEFRVTRRCLAELHTATPGDLPGSFSHPNTKQNFVCKIFFFDIVWFITAIAIVIFIYIVACIIIPCVCHIIPIGMLLPSRAHHRCLCEHVVHLLCSICEEFFFTSICCFSRQQFGLSVPIMCGQLHCSISSW